MRRLLLAVALLAAVLRLPQADDALRAEVRAGDAVSDRNGVAILPSDRPGLTELVATVRHEVPVDEPVRVVVQGEPCYLPPVTQGGGTYYWLQYQLLPHTITCAETAWTVYLDSTPPADAEVFGPGLALEHRT